MKKSKTEKTALYAIIGALALALSAAEGFLMPDVAILPPGAKPGLANIVTMFACSYISVPAAIYVTLIKSAFAFVTRGATAFFMSLAGGMLSVLSMTVMMKTLKDKISLVGVGVISALMHNTGQLAVSFVMTGTSAVLGYAPVLLLFGVVTGFVTGSILKVTIPAIEKVMKR